MIQMQIYYVKIVENRMSLLKIIDKIVSLMSLCETSAFSELEMNIDERT